MLWREYKHYISLGHFCSVALELERYGLRSASYPFDWLITGSMEGVYQAITEHFERFLDEDVLYQDREKHQVYHNHLYRCSFIHDFDAYSSLSDQLPDVRDRFKRRIDRFYRDITEPTLFIRYIYEDDDYGSGTDETGWIRDHIGDIITLLSSYNQDNDILWIANDGVDSADVDIYHVAPDPEDNVARRPFDKIPELDSFFSGVSYGDREHNLQVYAEKERRKKSAVNRLSGKIGGFMDSAFRKEYIHCLRE